MWDTGDMDAAGWAWATAMIGVAVLYYVVGPTAPSLILLAVLAYLCWQRVEIAISLIPLAVPFYLVPKNLHVGRNLDFSLGETIIVLCAAVVVGQLTLGMKPRPENESLVRYWLPETPFMWPALLLLGAAAVATLGAQFHAEAIRAFRELVVEPLLFYWMIALRLRGPADAVRLVLSVVGAGVVVAAMGVVEILFRAKDLVLAANEGGAPQHLVQAVYRDQNSLALLLDRALPAALALVLLPAWIALWPRPHGLVVPIRLGQGCLLVGSALMLYVLYRTGSRGGEMATAVTLGLLFLYWQRSRPWIVVGAAVAAAVVALIERHRLQNIFNSGHGNSNLAHTSIWHSAVDMIHDHPLLGVGPDNFLYYYTDDAHCVPGQPPLLAHHYYDQAGVNFERCVSHPHNLFLDFWLSTGVLGLVAALWLVALFVVLGLRAWRIASPVWKGPLTAVLLIMLAAVIHGEVDNSYFLPDLSVIFWLCLGVVTLWEGSDSG
jgi:O-antigen ligase